MEPDLRQTEADWQRRFMQLLVVVTILRLVWLFIAPLDLIADESYYWDWSRHLDWSYYSKPPMIAWIIGASTWFFGHSEVAVRLPALVLQTVSVCGVYTLGRRMAGARAGFWSAVVLLASPGNVVANTLMTIDAPLMAAWIWTVVFVWLALESDGRIGWWLAAAATCAFGVLSKQMMLVMPALTAAWCALSPPDRRQLRRPGLYLLVTGAAAALVPVIWWNARHQWITVEHTSHHFDGKGFAHALQTCPEFVAVQFGVLSPVTAFLLAATVIAVLRRFRSQSRAARFLVVFGPLALAAFLVLSLRQRINANWPAVFYLTGTVLVATWFCGTISCGPRVDAWRRLFLPGVWTGVALAVLTYLLPYAADAAGYGGTRFDPATRLRGWRDLGTAVTEVVDDLPRPERTFLVVDRRQQASALGFYMASRPQVYLWNSVPGRVRNQYDIWGGPSDKQGWDGLILRRQDKPVPDALAERFASIECLGPLEVRKGSGNTRSFTLYLGRGLQNGDW